MATLLMVVASATACGRDTNTTAGGTTQVTATTTTSVLAATTSTSRPAATTTTAAAAAVKLDADGLGVVSFGATKDAAVKALTTALGPSTATGKGCELAGPDVNTVSWKELSVQFAGGKFDAYTVRPAPGATPSLGLRTAEGAALGTTVATLKSTYGSRLTIPGLPPEFGGKDFKITFSGTTRVLRGSLSATSNDGTVTSFFTQTCE